MVCVWDESGVKLMPLPSFTELYITNFNKEYKQVLENDNPETPHKNKQLRLNKSQNMANSPKSLTKIHYNYY